ncbi:MAG TPA: amino acid adenylation domain-containing protein, partial [Chthonomonadaceae bacterium]|nr:amino acid adenylation domain-containing protein [Chthonomonadaceae bacterium]
GSETLVGLYVERSLEMVVGLLGVLKAGGAYVPLDPEYPQERIAHILTDSRAGVLLTQARLQARVPEVAGSIVLLDDRATLDAMDAGNPDWNVATTDPAYIIYTSGSTGLPKGVVVNHRNLVHSTCARRKVYSHPPTKFLLLSSFAFDSSIAGIFWTLCEGGCLMLPTRPVQENLDEVLDKMASEGVSHYLCVPSLHNVFLEEFGSRNMDALRTVIVAGEECPARQVADHFARLPQAELYNEYGPTEATVWASVWQADPNAIPETVPIGRPIENTQIYLLDAYGNPVPVGIGGELTIGGIGLTRGYLNRPDLTAEKFVPDPFSSEPGARLYRTGDLCRYLPDGNIEFLGRVDHQVKIRGFRIELGEIESVLSQHPGVREAVVLAREEGAGDKRLVAYVVGLPGLSLSALREHLREKLPDYMVPTAFVVMEAFPLSPNGKVDRKALPAPEPESRDEAYVAPRTPIEEGLVEIWSEVLGRERVGIHDNFFELGGHSLLATRVISRIRNIFQAELPVRALFEASTIADLAERILAARGEQAPAAPPLIRRSQEGPLPLSFAQQRLWFVHQLDPENPAYNLPCLLQIEGDLSMPALQRAAELLVQRHAVLRTTYVEAEGVPAQIVSPHAEVPLRVVDLSDIEEAQRAQEAQRLAGEELRTPFDLQQGPVLRAVLFRLDPANHLLALTMHHIASDGWSVALILQEIAALYEGCLQGDTEVLPELPVQYTDFAAWQRQWQETDAMQQQLRFWQQQLEGAPRTSNLPQDRPRPKMPSLRGDSMTIEMAPELADGLHTLSRREGATMFMVLLACFNALMYCTLDAEDVAVGTDMAGRNRAELEDLIGFFINHLVLRTDLRGDPDFHELVARVRSMALEAYAHQDMPFDRLVEILQPERDPAYTPLFQVLFVMQNALEPVAQQGSVRMRLASIENCTSKFDLALFFHESEHEGRRRLQGHWVYSTDLFDMSTIRKMAERFETVVAQMVSKPEQHLTELKEALLAADRVRRRAEQERRDAADFSRLQRIKPQPQNIKKTPSEHKP